MCPTTGGGEAWPTEGAGQWHGGVKTARRWQSCRSVRIRGGGKRGGATEWSGTRS
jgi:hypothetical protein